MVEAHNTCADKFGSGDMTPLPRPDCQEEPLPDIDLFSVASILQHRQRGNTTRLIAQMLVDSELQLLVHDTFMREHLQETYPLLGGRIHSLEEFRDGVNITWMNERNWLIDNPVLMLVSRQALRQQMQQGASITLSLDKKDVANVMQHQLAQE
jgi:hypothetical protein